MDNEVDTMMAFLRQHSDQQFCITCLALEFRLTFQAVDSALTAVGQSAALAEFLGRCAICGRLALVTGFERRSARSPAERVLHFVLDHVGRFFCLVCIARRLRLNIGTMQAAVRHLGALPEVRIDEMACSGCRRRRLVLGGVNRLDQAS
jgi:hypothetical protein